MLKDTLNEFQADWAAVPSADEKHLEKLRNKTISVSGHQLARCLCYALLYLNETKKLGIRVLYLPPKSGCADGFPDGLVLRDDFDVIDYNSDIELYKPDFAVHTAMCCEKPGDFGRTLTDETAYIRSAAERANGAKLILMSDSRVYGRAKAHRVYSENEYAQLDNTASDCFEAQLMRTLECYAACESKRLSLTVVTLRTGIILGADSGIYNPFEELFRAVAKGGTQELFISQKEYSFVYLNDVLSSILFSFAEISVTQAFNVVETNASCGMLAEVLRGIYGAEISLTDDGRELPFCAISGAKLEDIGFRPEVRFENALAMCVMSHMPDSGFKPLPHTHDGRLSAIQGVQLAMLLEVDRICRKHNIKYFLGGGTLLGAIRHKGFIPWDDDSDIMMLRADYDKFCEIAPAELPPELSFQSGKTDKSCFYEFSKLRLNGTTFATGFSKEHRDMHNGIALDIFCHDATADSALGRKLHISATLFTRALVFNKWNKRRAENNSRLQSALTNFFIRLFPLRFSYRLMNRAISFYKRKKNPKFLYDGMGRNVYNGAFPAGYLDEVIYTDFESAKLPVPKRYDEYLRFLYGDYTEPAPLSTRLGCHEIPLCDMGEYDGFADGK